MCQVSSLAGDLDRKLETNVERGTLKPPPNVIAALLKKGRVTYASKIINQMELTLGNDRATGKR